MHTTTTPQATPAPAALTPQQMFNGYVGAHVAFAFQERGLFEAMAAKRPTTDVGLAHATHSSTSAVAALLKAGLALGLVERGGDDTYTLTASGEATRHHVGFFTWAVGGYGPFFRGIPSLAAEAGPDHRPLIDGKFVALGSDQVNQAMMRSTLDDLLGRLPTIRCVADLGCGNAGRLINFCQMMTAAAGLGLDINASAVELAQRHVLERGMAERITVRRANVLEAIELPALKDELSRVELVTCFMMLHDLFAVEAPAEVMHKLRRAFPNAKHFVFADTFQMPAQDMASLPIFSVGFELVHGVMGIPIRTPEQYVQAFEAAGLRVNEMKPYGAPSTYLFWLEATP